MTYPTPEQVERIRAATAFNTAERMTEPAFKELYDVGIEISGVKSTPETETALQRLFTYAVGVGGFAERLLTRKR